ncbi:MAG: alkaline phosphatase D family protein, partial [Pseudonocardiaceae bacterium]
MSSVKSIPDDSGLILGPILRYVDADSATIWVQAAHACQVRIVAGETTATALTFAVHDHHYALVDLTGLPADSHISYTVWLDDRPVWPPTDSDLPASTIRTTGVAEPVRLLWGSCRRDAGDGSAVVRLHGMDSLRAYAAELAAPREATGRPSLEHPSQLLLIGDQIYADSPSEPMREFLAAKRDVSEPPGEELVDYIEYAESYRLAWSEPTIRWLLSCVPSMMIFDDHDVRDDWNTSASWREQMRAEPWWRGRIVAGLTSYWVYQHAGNLSPGQRASDAYGGRIAAAGDTMDLGPALDAVSAAVDDDSSSYRWSYARRVGPVQLLMLDSRCGRTLE